MTLRTIIKTGSKLCGFIVFILLLAFRSQTQDPLSACSQATCNTVLQLLFMSTLLTRMARCFESCYGILQVAPVSYPMGTGGSFPGSKAAGAWSYSLTSI